MSRNKLWVWLTIDPILILSYLLPIPSADLPTHFEWFSTNRTFWRIHTSCDLTRANGFGNHFAFFHVSRTKFFAPVLHEHLSIIIDSFILTLVSSYLSPFAKCTPLRGLLVSKLRCNLRVLPVLDDRWVSNVYSWRVVYWFLGLNDFTNIRRISGALLQRN